MKTDLAPYQTPTASPPSPLPSGSQTVMDRLRGLALDARCLAVLCVMRAALSLVGYGKIRRHLPRPPGRADSHFWGRQVSRRIERLARLVPNASCLTQALALQYVLGRAGHASQLQIGVRQTGDGQFSAHAWVICNDRVVLGHQSTQLAEFTRIADLG